LNDERKFPFLYQTKPASLPETKKAEIERNFKT